MTHRSFELKPFDAAREQHNTGVWSRAMQARGLGYSYDETVRFLDEWVWLNRHLFQRDIPEPEIRKQVRQAFERLDTRGTAWKHKDPHTPPGLKPTKKVGKPAQDAALIAEIDTKLRDHTLAELRGSSPLDPEFANLHHLFDSRFTAMARCQAELDEGDPTAKNPRLCWGFFRWCDVDKKAKPQVRTRQDWCTQNPFSCPIGAGFEGLWHDPNDPFCRTKLLLYGHRERLTQLQNENKTPKGDSLLILRSNGKNYTPSLSEYTFPELIVPNPMHSPTGTTQSGRLSNRCLDNATRPENRLFWVVDIDNNPDGTPGVCWDSQARRLLWLSGGMRLVMVVHSGGKSLQAWYSPQTPEARDNVDAWVALAISIGADPAAFVPSQPLRFPWGLRRNRDKKTGVLSPEKPYTMQEVYYLDKAPGLVTKGGFSC